MYYHNNELPPRQGWVCPKCGRVNAPWIPTCGCTTPTFTADGITYLNVKECLKQAEQTEPSTDCSWAKPPQAPKGEQEINTCVTYSAYALEKLGVIDAEQTEREGE